MAATSSVRVDGVVHRIIHGGLRFKKPCLATTENLLELEGNEVFAPLHLGMQIEAVRGCMDALPESVQILVFETSAYVDLPSEECLYAVPGRDGGPGPVRRYGYQGIFHSEAIRLAREAFGDSVDGLRIISICLDSLPEVAGFKDGRMVFTSSGITPLEGICGETKCGELDPDIPLALVQKGQMVPGEIDHILNRCSGLTALAGREVTLARVLRDTADDGCGLAREVLLYQLLKFSGMAVGKLGGVDAVIFTGKYSHAWKPVEEMLTCHLGLDTALLEGSRRHCVPFGDHRAYVLVSRRSRFEIMARLALEETARATV